ncbi:MAG: nucleotide-binding universal stress UspA family protein, partial [Natronomonas sp.]|jgi:nucleotide-binding universal stress UspA family protein|uniref:universal stress protein n=1 Tax=Natronomonas sp. TaxID=2184060 RepID=UPI003988B602
MPRNVLVPVDGSEPASDALAFAADHYPDATITALHVIDPSDYPAGGFESGVMTDLEQMRENKQQHAENLLEDVRERLTDQGVDVETAIESGKPSNVTVEYADEHDIDLITIGSHGRTGASRVLLGSVAETVVRRSPVPVTVVR